MSYDLHIEESGKTLQEWREFVRNSPDLMLEKSSESLNPNTGETISVRTPDAAVARNGLLFSPRLRGNEISITVFGPDESDITFVQKIAGEFGGVLIGDEGERYPAIINSEENELVFVEEKSGCWMLFRMSERYFLSVVVQRAGAVWATEFELNQSEIDAYKSSGNKALDEIDRLVSSNIKRFSERQVNSKISKLMSQATPNRFQDL